jgi:hypothetical protein
VASPASCIPLPEQFHLPKSFEYFIHFSKTSSSYIVILGVTSASLSAFVRSRSRRSHTGHVLAVTLMYLVILCYTLHSWVMYFDPSNVEIYLFLGGEENGVNRRGGIEENASERQSPARIIESFF